MCQKELELERSRGLALPHKYEDKGKGECICLKCVAAANILNKITAGSVAGAHNPREDMLFHCFNTRGR